MNLTLRPSSDNSYCRLGIYKMCHIVKCEISTTLIFKFKHNNQPCCSYISKGRIHLCDGNKQPYFPDSGKVYIRVFEEHPHHNNNHSGRGCMVRWKEHPGRHQFQIAHRASRVHLLNKNSMKVRPTRELQQYQ